MEIGVQSGAEEYQLHRAESSIRLDDGTYVPMGWMAGELICP